MLITINDLFLPVLWAALALCVCGILALTKRYAPLTDDEARILWKIHKLSAQCPAKHWKKIVHRSKLVGFKCGCGYRHTQRRPMT